MSVLCQAPCTGFTAVESAWECAQRGVLGEISGQGALVLHLLHALIFHPLSYKSIESLSHATIPLIPP